MTVDCTKYPFLPELPDLHDIPEWQLARSTSPRCIQGISHEDHLERKAGKTGYGYGHELADLLKTEDEK